jgi:uncharacterized protein YqgV (UPF0045/DUF77 family)
LHEVLNTLKEAVTGMHDAGVDRIFTTVQIESRRSGVSSIKEKLASVA